MIGTIALLISMTSQNLPPIPMGGVPRKLPFETTDRAVCEDRTYSISVENRGFLPSRLISATVNGKPVEFRSVRHELEKSLRTLDSVLVEPLSCDSKDQLRIAVIGVDQDKSSPTYGEEKIIIVGSEAD